jgi:ribosome biogenesis protein Nip4
MRPLTEDETKTLFLKLSEYIGKNVEKMINRSDERHCFRLMKDRCYYISESLMKAATNISRDNLLHVGTCIGKFTKSGKFRLHITALEYLSQYAKVRRTRLEKKGTVIFFQIEMLTMQKILSSSASSSHRYDVSISMYFRIIIIIIITILAAKVQGLGETVGRNVLFVWKPCHKKRIDANDRKYTAICWSGSLQYAGHSIGIWRGCAKYGSLSNTGKYG